MKRTAITRKSPSVPMRYLAENNLLVGRTLDYGSGRGFDAEYYGMERYDPNFAPEKPSKGFDTITCNYVLNVVDIVTQIAILDDIKALLVEGGIAYVSVRRDLKRMITTHVGYSQRLVTLSGGWKLIKETGSYAMYRLEKNELRGLEAEFNSDYMWTTEGAQYRKQNAIKLRIDELKEVTK